MPHDDGKAAATRDAALAGAVAGGASRLVAAPLDLLKIRFQVQQAPIASQPGAKYVGLVQSIRSIHAEEGLRGFWRGNLAATGLWISYSAVQFGAYGGLQTLWPVDVAQQHAPLVSSVNGATAGVLATVVTYPLDLFRTIFASQGVPRQFATLQSLARHTLATRGVAGFYNGLAPTLFQIAPYMGLSFGIYAALNDLTASSGVHWVLSYVGTGATAGLVSKLMVYPLDTVKKRMQIRQLQRNPSYGVVTPYSSSWACLLDIVRREGVRGLYKGTVPSLLKAVVTHSSTFASYEVALVVLQRLRQDQDEDADDDEMDKL